MAATILACTVAASSAVLSHGVAAGGRAGSRDRARSIVENEIERLRSLDFCPSGALVATTGTSLLAAVFPHADPARNTAAASYRGAGADPLQRGTFVTATEVGGGVLTVTARFVVSSRDAWVALDPDQVDGWSVDGWRPPPAAALVVVATWSTAGEGAASARPPASLSTVFAGGPP